MRSVLTSSSQTSLIGVFMFRHHRPVSRLTAYQNLRPRHLLLGFGCAVACVIMLRTAPAHAQAIDTVAQAATGHIDTAFGYMLNTICFIGGAILLAMAVFGWWQHQRNPNAGARPTMVLAGFICGGLLLAFPFVVKTATFTVFGQGPSATGAQQQMQFNQ